MRAAGLEPTLISYNAIIFAHVRALELDAAFGVPSTSTSSPSLMSVETCSPSLIPHCDLYHTANVTLMQVREQMARARLEPDRVTFNTLLKGCATERRIDDAFGLVREMESRAEKDPELRCPAWQPWGCACSPAWLLET